MRERGSSGFLEGIETGIRKRTKKIAGAGAVGLAVSLAGDAVGSKALVEAGAIPFALAYVGLAHVWVHYVLNNTANAARNFAERKYNRWKESR